MQTFKLKNDKEIPSLGFGTWQLLNDEARESVEYALETGYRHIDTAEIYNNHREVGESIKSSEINRSELFVTSKLWRSDYKIKDVKPALKTALEDLQLDYLDLYLIHWPDRNISLEGTLGQMFEAMEEGLVKSVGVSNFNLHHLKDTKDFGFDITNNQVEFHPSLNQNELLSYCKRNNIVLTAYSPIAQGEDLKLNEVQQLSKKYEKSPAQVILNWLRQKGIVAIPRSSSKEHIKDNFESLEWELELEDVNVLNDLNSNNRLINPPFGDFDY